ncbi:MAG: Diaphanous [Marteilia pararefringens]
MNDLKSTDNKVSLMLFMAQQIENRHPEVGNFVYELDFVIQASKVSYQDAKKNFDEISKSLTKLKISYQKIKEEEPSSKYNDIVSEFLKDSEDEIQELTEIDELIQKSYDKILIKLSLDKKHYDLSAIISTIAKITMNYVHAKEEYKKKMLAEERKNSQKRSNTGGANNVSKFTSKANSNISEDKQNLMSDLMSSLNNPRAKKNKIKNL